MKKLAAAIAIATLVSQAALAEDRFAVIERGDTTIRVDTQTGRVSYCKEESGKPVCKIAAEEREAWMAEVETLQNRIEELEAKSPGEGNGLSSKENEDLDKAMETAETMMRRFFGIMKSLRNDLEKN